MSTYRQNLEKLFCARMPLDRLVSAKENNIDALEMLTQLVNASVENQALKTEVEKLKAASNG